MECDFKINQRHLDQFLERSCKDDQLKWRGRSFADWYSRVFGSKPKQNVSKLDRETLKMICLNRKDYNDKTVFAAIMAWGGMRIDHGEGVVTSCIQKICDVISKLRNNSLSSLEGYSKFYDLRRDGHLPYMRPAYYTKLIFFCSPEHDGYIMDQWTAKSINMLFDPKPIVHLTSGYVDDRNTLKEYKKFCDSIRHLTAHGGRWDHEETEIRLFSHGGKKPGGWRKYVKDYYSGK